MAKSQMFFAPYSPPWLICAIITLTLSPSPKYMPKSPEHPNKNQEPENEIIEMNQEIPESGGKEDFAVERLKPGESPDISVLINGAESSPGPTETTQPKEKENEPVEEKKPENPELDIEEKLAIARKDYANTFFNQYYFGENPT